MFSERHQNIVNIYISNESLWRGHETFRGLTLRNFPSSPEKAVEDMVWIVTNFSTAMIHLSKGTQFCRGWRARSKTGGLAVKGGRMAPKMAKYGGSRQWFRRPIGTAPMLVSSWDFKRGMVDSWASSTCDVCKAPAAGRQSNGGGKLTTRRGEKREKLWERERERERSA